MNKIILTFLAIVLTTTAVAKPAKPVKSDPTTESFFVIANDTTSPVQLTRLANFAYMDDTNPLNDSNLTPTLWGTTLKSRSSIRVTSFNDDLYAFEYESGVATILTSNGSGIPVCFITASSRSYKYSAPYVHVKDLDSRYHCEFDQSQLVQNQYENYSGDLILKIKPGAAKVSTTNSRLLINNTINNGSISLASTGMDAVRIPAIKNTSIASNTSKLMNVVWRNGVFGIPKRDDNDTQAAFEVVASSANAKQTICSGELQKEGDNVRATVKILNPQYACKFDQEVTSTSGAVTLTVGAN